MAAWTPAEATKKLNALAKNIDLDLALTKHAKDRMQERDFIIGDILHILEFGFVFKKGEKASRKACFKYEIEGKPTSGNRAIRVVVIAEEDKKILKIKTIMWKDER